MLDEYTLAMVKSAMAKLHPDEPHDAAKVAALQFFAPGEVDCEQCGGVGYYGRVGLFEVLKMNNDLRDMILKQASTVAIQDAAMKTGMVTLEQAGILKALDGITSLEEVYSVARPEQS